MTSMTQGAALLPCPCGAALAQVRGNAVGATGAFLASRQHMQRIMFGLLKLILLLGVLGAWSRQPSTRFARSG
jgi:hypothetical protein